jgi:hypothetical protein
LPSVCLKPSKLLASERGLGAGSRRAPAALQHSYSLMLLSSYLRGQPPIQDAALVLQQRGAA